MTSDLSGGGDSPSAHVTGYNKQAYKEAASMKTAKQKAEQARFEAEVAQRVLDERPDWTGDSYIQGLVQRKQAAADTAERAANDVQLSEAEKALEVLVTRGREYFTDREGVSSGKALGAALFGLMEPHQIREAALAGLEQWNEHLLVAVMIATGAGSSGNADTTGTMVKDGRTVTITLPKWWDPELYK